MVVKAIHQPDVYLKNTENVNSSEIVSRERIERSLTPIFFGSCDINEDDKEMLNQYKFDLYDGYKDSLDESKINLIESSGWLQHNAFVDSIDSYRFKTALQNEKAYTVFYSIKTVNGYEETTQPYQFIAIQSYLLKLENLTLRVDSSSPYCSENGCINIYLTTGITEEGIPARLSGSYVISRTSEKSNFKVWENLKYLNFFAKELNDELVFQDFSIESGVKYQYAIQSESSTGVRSNLLQEKVEVPHWVDFEYSYLYCDNIQLRLSYNQKMSSFKYTTLTSKQDTLGGKFPKVSKNGYAHYAEFSITGLISFQMDEDQTFMKLKDEGFYYKDELVIPKGKFTVVPDIRAVCESRVETYGQAADTGSSTLITNSTQLSNDNIYIERKFREKVEEFLNDFNYKLYKSPTEGNIVVVLDKISLTPNATVGRMIYEFSATAYEVAENTLPILDEVGIINIGSFGELTTDEIFTTIGQISGSYNTIDKNENACANRQDIFSEVQNQEEVSIDNVYALKLNHIKSFWVERYPEHQFVLEKKYNESGELEPIESANERIKEALDIEIIQLEAELSQAKINEEPTEELERQLKEYRGIKKQVREGWKDLPAELEVNGKTVFVMPYKIYSLTMPIISLKVIKSAYPLIINYSCEMARVEDKKQGILKAVDTGHIWGQVAGIFTNTESIVKAYNYNSGAIDQVPLQVFEDGEIKNFIKDQNGNILFDYTNYNLYKTLNIYKMIEEDTQRQVELIYNKFVLGKFEDTDNGYKEKDGYRFYYDGITSLEIEAEPGTTFYIGASRSGNDAIEVKIGRNGKYRLVPPFGVIQYFKLAEPAFVLVNYKSLVTIATVEYDGKGDGTSELILG